MASGSSNVEVVKVTHDQVKDRAERFKKNTRSSRDDYGTESKSQADLGKDESIRSKSGKARKEKEQRKPDQQLYRPGRSRSGRNSATATELNSQSDESPTKSAGKSSVSEEIGSRGDEKSASRNVEPKRESLAKEEGKQERRKEDGPPSKNSDKSRQHERQRGGRNRRGRNDERAVAEHDSGREETRRAEKPEKSHVGKNHGRRTSKDEPSRITSDGKGKVRNDGEKSDESWEIKPEDWEADIQTPPRGVKSRNSESKNPPTQALKKKEKGKPDEPHEEANESNASPSKIQSLMGTDWDDSFEEQLQTQRRSSRSPPKPTHVSGRQETGERLGNMGHVEKKEQNIPSAKRQNQDSKSKVQAVSYKGEHDTRPSSKKDLVKSSRQNYATEMQKLRAKKEQVEKENVEEANPSAQISAHKDLQITIKGGESIEAVDSARIVQEKPTKRYSSARTRQRMNSESSTGSENIVMEKIATSSEKWDASVDELNFHVESLVITNQKFTSGNRDDVRRFGGPHSDKGQFNREEKRIADEKSLVDTRPSGPKKHSEDRKGHRGERHKYDKSDSQKLEREWHERKQDHYEKQKLDDHHDRRRRDDHHQQQQHRRKPEKDQRGQEVRGRNDSGGKRDAQRRRDRERTSVSSDDGSVRHIRSRGNSETEDASASHGGGILRLPSNTEQERLQQQQQHHHHNYVPVYDRYYQPPEPQREVEAKQEDPTGKPKARAGDKSLLWDPNKPNQKPALHQHQGKPDLHFHDPEMEKADIEEREGSPSGQQNSWNSYPSMYPPGYGGVFPGGQPPFPGMNPPFAIPPGYPAAPPQSWADQVEVSQAYMSGGAPPRLPPHMHYPPPYGGQPFPLPPGMPPPPGFPNAQLAMMQEHHPVNRQSAQKLLRDAAQCEKELLNALGHGIASRESLQILMDKRRELEQLYEGIILLDLDLCNQYNVEQTMWKNSYYQLIEALRKAIKDDSNGDSYKEDLLDLMEHGTSFYEGLLKKLQSTYNFQLENRTGLDPLHEESRRSIKMALLSSQRCMIALGDIARYKEQANESNSYGKARSWYMKAQHLAPRNGRPYNQLAILALYTRRKLDAVYFYVRSLASTNPFLTARESLMTLFEEVRRKVLHKEQEEMAERREIEKKREQRRRRRRPSQDDSRGRTEVWVAHDGRQVGGERLEEEEEEAEMREDLTKLLPAELNKKFVLSFLNVHGKLFTKIGMEAFEHSVEKLLREFKALLDYSPTAILSTRLIQLMAINMFAVSNTSPEGESPSQEDVRPLIVEQAVQLGLDMFSVLVKRCCLLLQEHLDLPDSSANILSQDLHELLPGVKVYADWMMCHSSLWNPPPCCNTTSYGAAVDVWSTLAEFLTLVKRVSVPDVKFASSEDEDSQKVLLPEDMALSGFVPLLALPLQPVFIQADTSKILAYDRVRLDSLAMFGEYLSGQETPLISFTVKTDSYVSVAPKDVQPRHPQQGQRLQNDEYNDDQGDVIVMGTYDADDVTQDDGTISRLRERRDSLERQVRDRERRETEIQAIVESHRTQRQLEIIIKPLYLIPDTNCFIDHLPGIQWLISCERYRMVVPIVVINELDGLARGSREGQYKDPAHASKVQQGAQQGVAYLEETFASRNRNIRAITSKGTLMDSIRFRSQEAEWRGNNDDHILWCCMQYCQDDARQYMPQDKDSPLRIERQVVLLTNDRNLRVKAIQQNVPVKDIDLFVRWAKV